MSRSTPSSSSKPISVLATPPSLFGLSIATPPSKPISVLTTPPSLFGSSVSTLPALTKSSAPKKKKGHQPRKQKPGAGKKKKAQPLSPRSVSEGSDEGGDFEMADEVCSPTFEASSASVIEQSNLRKTFKFSQDDADEPVSEPVSETKVQNHPNASIGVIDWKSRDTEYEEGNKTAVDEEGNKTAVDEEGTDDDDDENDDDDDADDDDEDETDSDRLDAVIDRGLFKLPCTDGLIDSFSAGVKSYVLNKLRGMSKEEPAPDAVLEIADSIDLLKLLGASGIVLDGIGSKMREGVELYNRGMKNINRGQNLLCDALSEISFLE